MGETGVTARKPSRLTIESTHADRDASSAATPSFAIHTFGALLASAYAAGHARSSQAVRHRQYRPRWS